MKIGISLFAFVRWPLEERYKKVKEMGFDAVDFSLSQTQNEPYTLNDADFAEFLATNRRLAEEAGVIISQVHGPWIWPPHDDTPENREERLEKMKRCLKATRLLGCPYMVVHPIMPFGIEDKDLGKEAETRALNRAFFTELLKTAHEEEVTIALENMPMPHFSIGSPEEIMDFVKEMNDDRLLICLDTGHVSVYDSRQPHEALPVFGDYLKVTHVHDNNGKNDLHLLPYHGVIDWDAFSRALRESGFDGVLSLETEPKGTIPTPAFEDMLKACAKMARTIADGE